MKTAGDAVLGHTSSLLKLYVQEAGSDDVRQLVDEASVVATSMVAYPESRAALARLRRSGEITAASLAKAKARFESDWPAYLALEVTAPLGREAGEFAEVYGLGGYDAVHLASFAEVTRRAGSGETRFSSYDDRLNRAARDVQKRLYDRG